MRQEKGFQGTYLKQKNKRNINIQIGDNRWGKKARRHDQCRGACELKKLNLLHFRSGQVLSTLRLYVLIESR